VEKVAKAGYFEKEKKEQQKGEEAFFKQGEKPEVGLPLVETLGCKSGS
jgi:hypothetical protein